MADIHLLDGSIAPETDVPVDHEVIAQLEWMVTEAKAGRILALAAVVREQDGVSTVQRGLWRGGFFEALGAMTVLLHDMSSGSAITIPLKR